MKNFTQRMRFVLLNNRKCVAAQWLLVMLLLPAISVEAQQKLVRDINSLPDASAHGSPHGFAAIGDVLLFTATSLVSGEELWKMDGAGTVLVKDINEGEGSSSPVMLASLGNTLYFMATQEASGRELWRTDGTKDGTFLVKDILPGPESGGIVWARTLNGVLYFWATFDENGISNASLWKTDGTTEGTVKVKSGFNLQFDDYVAVMNDALYFAARDQAHGSELWRSDGTPEGTTLVKDINVGGSSYPHYLTAVGNILYFVAGGADGYELWKSDGTESGTVQVKDILPGSDSPHMYGFTAFDGKLFFTANNRIHGLELWVSDGTPDGTKLVADIDAGTAHGDPSDFVVMNNELYFRARTASSGFELWKSDGTTAGTVMVTEINPQGSAGISSLTVVGDLLYFGASTAESGSEPWISDGTAGGTKMLKDIYPGTGSALPVGFTLFNDQVYFSANNGVVGAELWKTDGTTDGTMLLKDFNQRSVNSRPEEFINIGAVTFFRADDGLHGRELWKTDGTETGTVMVKDISTGSTSGIPNPAHPHNLTNVNGTLFFVAHDVTHGYQLWKSDGTEAGTVMIKVIGNSGQGEITAVNDIAYFSADDGVNGRELWRSDGTEPGTYMVKNIAPGSASGRPQNLINVAGTLYFTANDDTHGVELWKSDGTEEGTVLVRDIRPGAEASEIQQLTGYNGSVFFRAADGASGHELWKSDGTESGTVLVKDIYPGTDSGYPAQFAATGNALFFSAHNATTGAELWKTDGTAEGTVLVKDIMPGTSSSSLYNLTSFNGFLIFFASDNLDNSELWRSDGTEAGTVLVKDMNPGEEGSDGGHFINVNGILYFIAWTGTSTTQLWRTNGTECSTVRLTSEGYLDDKPLTFLNGKLIFQAFDEQYGEELFSYSLSDELPSCDQQITFNELPHKNYLDAPFTPTASASSGLSVLFSSSNPEIASVNDNIVTIHKTGSVTITARQAGDRLFFPASASQTLWISKATQIITFNALPDKRLSDEMLTLQATASSGLPVSYVSSHPDIASIEGNRLIFHKAGMIAIAANQEGNENYEPASQVPQTLTILKNLQSIAFAGLPSKILGEAPFALSATASSSLPVIFESSDPAVATVTGNTVTIRGAGTTTITASQLGNDTFEHAVPVEQTLTVQLVTDLGEAPGDALIKVYPNPVHDVLNIGTPSAGAVSVEMFDSMGRAVASESSSGDGVTLRVDHLQPGVYYLKVRTGRLVVTQPVVKK